MRRDEQALGNLSVGHAFGHQPSHRQLGLGQGCPTRLGAVYGRQAPPDAAGPQPGPYPAGVPGSARFGLDHQRAAEGVQSDLARLLAEGQPAEIFQR